MIELTSLFMNGKKQKKNLALWGPRSCTEITLLEFISCKEIKHNSFGCESHIVFVLLLSSKDSQPEEPMKGKAWKKHWKCHKRSWIPSVRWFKSKLSASGLLHAMLSL
jgi:hypothetical protein